jgi:hypothetical protein
MRYGSMILFLMTIWEVAAGLTETWARWEATGIDSATGLSEHASPGVRLLQSVHYFGYAIVPFLGALIIYRIDRWLNTLKAPEPGE